MEFITFIKDNSDIINIILVVLVFPLLESMRQMRKKERKHDEYIMTSIDTSNKAIASSSKAIEQLRRDMLVSQRRHERIEDAVLFLANDEKVKDVIAILRGYKKEDKNT
jgi:hypothetical protein